MDAIANVVCPHVCSAGQWNVYPCTVYDIRTRTAYTYKRMGEWKKKKPVQLRELCIYFLQWRDSQQHQNCTYSRMKSISMKHQFEFNVQRAHEWERPLARVVITDERNMIDRHLACELANLARGLWLCLPFYNLHHLSLTQARFFLFNALPCTALCVWNGKVK